MQTSPKHWLDFVFWPLLKIFWEPFSKKRSHFWHWKSCTGKFNFWVRVAGNPLAKKRRSNLFSNLFQSNFGWQKVVILKPVVNQPYQIGFIAQETSDHQNQELCSLVLTGPCAGLVGPNDVTFFALGFPSGEPIKLKMLIIATKKTLPRGVTLI